MTGKETISVEKCRVKVRVIPSCICCDHVCIRDGVVWCWHKKRETCSWEDRTIHIGQDIPEWCPLEDLKDIVKDEAMASLPTQSKEAIKSMWTEAARSIRVEEDRISGRSRAVTLMPY
jgi:hypothetical protein